MCALHCTHMQVYNAHTCIHGGPCFICSGASSLSLALRQFPGPAAFQHLLPVLLFWMGVGHTQQCSGVPWGVCGPVGPAPPNCANPPAQAVPLSHCWPQSTTSGFQLLFSDYQPEKQCCCFRSESIAWWAMGPGVLLSGGGFSSWGLLRQGHTWSEHQAPRTLAFSNGLASCLAGTDQGGQEANCDGVAVPGHGAPGAGAGEPPRPWESLMNGFGMSSLFRFSFWF